MADGTSPFETQGTGTGISPQQRVTIPEFVDYHMILDSELDQLSKPETGILGSIGFMALGTCIGLMPSLISGFGKIEAKPPIVLTPSDVASMLICVGCLVLAITCLVLFTVSIWRNAGTAKKIRMRKQSSLSR